MAEFVYNPVQVVQPNQNVLLNSSIPCNKGYILHREGAGIVTLRGAASGCNSFARYEITYGGNIAVPEDGTVGPISVALAIDGETVEASKAIVTPAAVNEYFPVQRTAIIDVPKCCCYTVAVENSSEGATAADAATAINVQNANLVVTRIA